MVDIDWDLLKARIKKKYDDGKLETIFTLGKTWTPEEQLEAVENETREGIEFMLAEKRYMEELRKDLNVD